MKKLSILLIYLLALTSVKSLAGSFLLEEHNLVTVDDVKAQSLHVYGSTLIGGDLNSAGLTFGERLTDFDTSLTVAGQFVQSQGASISAKGNVVVGEGNDIFAVNASQTKVNGTYVNNSKTVTSQDLTNTNDDILTNLQAASNVFKDLKMNSNVSLHNDKTHKFVTDKIAQDDYAVFSLDAADAIFNNTPNQEIEILANSVAGIVINVSGQHIDLATNFIGGSNNDLGNIIWNFYDALTINISRMFYGSILAPLATLSSSNDIEGSVGVYSISSSHSGQIHNQINTLVPPSEVPEPSAWILFGLLALVLKVNSKRLTK